MASYFTLSDIFITVDVNMNNEMFIFNHGSMPYYDSDDFWDRKKIAEIEKNFICISGKNVNYWITGSILNLDDTHKGKVGRCKKFAIWYHENRQNLTVIDLNR